MHGRTYTKESISTWTPTKTCDLATPKQSGHIPSVQTCPSPPITLTDAKKSINPAWNPKLQRPFVYTPLHGVGGLVFPDLCRSVGIHDYFPVPEQLQPDPDFPTVSFPNPEEAGALDLAMQTADKDGTTLIIAHDPDADRFAAAEKVKYVCSPGAAV